jgi:lysophospholipase L1-like esterase
MKTSVATAGAAAVALAASCHSPAPTGSGSASDAERWTWIAPTDPRVLLMGRAERTEAGELRFGYPGVTVRVAFEGPALAIDASCAGPGCRLRVRVDGTPHRDVTLGEGAHRTTLVEGLAEREHTVEIVHLTETWQGVVGVRAIGVGPAGRFVAAAPWPARRLLFIGDSVTCGEGVDRSPGPPKGPLWWDAERSYGMLAARALDAQVHLVCFGGQGLIRDWRGRRDALNAPAFFELAIADQASPRPWDHAAYVPDAVVVSLGTNDFNLDIGPLPDREEYVSTYVRFVQAIRGHYPFAQVLLTEGSIVNDEADPKRPQKTVLREYLAETAGRLGDPRVHVVPSTRYPGEGGDAHPNAEQHERMALDIEGPLRAATGWR